MIWSIAKAVLTFSVPVPVALLVAGIGAYKVAAYLDKTAAIDAAISELVAGAELSAERAKTLAAEKRAAASKDLLKVTETQLQAEKRALAEFQAAAQENETFLQDQIDDLLSTPAKPDADSDFVRKLRNQ